ncbi:hypothetical protein ONZ45_g11784 [Pleurotus djamor]|nr:hypothetical protein ONZ45_g11784 [Pleurotus djamor]
MASHSQSEVDPNVDNLAKRIHLDQPHTFDRLHALVAEYEKEKIIAEGEKKLAMDRWDAAAEQSRILDKDFDTMMTHFTKEYKEAFNDIVSTTIGLVQNEKEMEVPTRPPLPEFPIKDLTAEDAIFYRRAHSMISQKDIEQLSICGRMSSVVLASEVKVLAGIRQKFDAELEDLSSDSRRKRKEARELEIRNKYKRDYIKGDFKLLQELTKIKRFSGKISSNEAAVTTTKRASQTAPQAPQSAQEASSSRKRKLNDAPHGEAKKTKVPKQNSESRSISSSSKSSKSRASVAVSHGN